MNSIENKLSCLEDYTSQNITEYVMTICSSPENNIRGHQRNQENVNKSLGVMESDCKTELDGGYEKARMLYNGLTKHEKDVTITCIKSTKEADCIPERLKMTFTERKRTICQGYNKNIIEGWINWKFTPPIKYTLYTQEIVKTMLSNANYCNTTASISFNKANYINNSNLSAGSRFTGSSH
jgi:hypothetical protein